jgi:hypothetical protein
MNDKKTATDETTARASRRWFQRPRTWVIAALLAFVVWFVTPSSYSAGDIRFTVHHSGSPGTVTFVVRHSGGQPLPGVTVMSESFSGTTQEFVTDASGIATIRPGESEVLAVYIQGHEFRFRPQYLEHFAPDCSRGLTLNVSIQRDSKAES